MEYTEHRYILWTVKFWVMFFVFQGDRHNITIISELMVITYDLGDAPSIYDSSLKKKGGGGEKERQTP